MSFAETLLAPHHAVNRGATCGVALMLVEMDQSDPDAAEALRTVLDDTRMPSTVIAKRLTDGGWDIASAVVQRHRRGECKCPT